VFVSSEIRAVSPVMSSVCIASFSTAMSARSEMFWMVVAVVASCPSHSRALSRAVLAASVWSSTLDAMKLAVLVMSISARTMATALSVSEDLALNLWPEYWSKQVSRMLEITGMERFVLGVIYSCSVRCLMDSWKLETFAVLSMFFSCLCEFAMSSEVALMRKRLVLCNGAVVVFAFLLGLLLLSVNGILCITFDVLLL
jgi:hypothetical protein